MDTMELTKMEFSNQTEIRFGEKVFIEISQIESVDPVTIWPFDKYFQNDGTEKLSSDKYENCGCLIKTKGNQFFLVMESRKYIEKCMSNK